MHWSRGNCFETVALKLLKWMIEWSPDLHLCDFTLFQFNHSLAQEAGPQAGKCDRSNPKSWARRGEVYYAGPAGPAGAILQISNRLDKPCPSCPTLQADPFPSSEGKAGKQSYCRSVPGWWRLWRGVALSGKQNDGYTFYPSLCHTHRALRGTSWSMAYSLHPEEDSSKMLNRSVKSVVSPSWLGSNLARRRLQQRFFWGWLRSKIYYLSFCENWDAAKASGISVLRDWKALIWRWVPASEPLDSFGRQRCFHDSKLSLHHRIGTMQSQFAWDLPNFATRNGWRHSHLRVVVKISACRNLKGALLQGFLWRCYCTFKAQQSPLPKKRQRRCYISCRFFQCQWTPVACRTGALKQEDQHGWATGPKWQ